MTQDDLACTFYQFCRIPEINLVTKHVSFAKKCKIPKLTFRDLTLTRHCFLTPKYVRYASKTIADEFLMQNWPKNMCLITLKSNINMVTFGDLTLT